MVLTSIVGGRKDLKAEKDMTQPFMCISKSVVDARSELEKKPEHFFCLILNTIFKGLDSALQAEVYEKDSQHHPNQSSLFLHNTEVGSSVPCMRNAAVFYSLPWQNQNHTSTAQKLFWYLT